MPALDDAEPLKPKQLKALVALAAGATDEKAADVAGVSRPTIAKWRRLPAFSAALQDHLRLQRDRIQGILGALVQDSERVIRDAMSATKDDGATDHATRLRAAEASLSNYNRIAQRVEQGAAGAAGPLIVLPPGTQRMALMLDDGGAAAPGADAVIDVKVTSEPGASRADVTEGNAVGGAGVTLRNRLTAGDVRLTSSTASTPASESTPSTPSTCGSTSHQTPAPAAQVSPIALGPDDADDAGDAGDAEPATVPAAAPDH